MIATEALRHGADLTIGIIPQDKELVEEFIREAKQTMPDAKVQYAVTADIHDKFDVIINASPVGTFSLPVPDKRRRFHEYVKNRIALVPEERRKEGVLVAETVTFNIFR